ncbi:hypothetical protein ACVIN2_005874 [Bradyrhizobium sp. USDA 3650]
MSAFILVVDDKTDVETLSASTSGETSGPAASKSSSRSLPPRRWHAPLRPAIPRSSSYFPTSTCRA